MKISRTVPKQDLNLIYREILVSFVLINSTVKFFTYFGQIGYMLHKNFNFEDVMDVLVFNYILETYFRVFVDFISCCHELLCMLYKIIKSQVQKYRT